MSFKDSDFRSLVLTAENLKSYYGTSMSQDEIARDLIVDPGFVDQLQNLLQVVLMKMIVARRSLLTLASKRVDLFDPFMDDPLNW